MKITELNVELHYVSCCLDVISDFGYWDSGYYNALIEMYDSAISGIYELGLEEKYEAQIIDIPHMASEFGIELSY